MSCERCLRELATGAISSGPQLLRHVEDCAECRELWVAAGLLARSMPHPAGTGTECAASADLLAWWDGSLEQERSRAIAGHVASCRGCLGELTAIFRDLDRLEDARPVDVSPALERAALERAAAASDAIRPDRPTWWVALPAAAGVAFVALGLGLLLLDPSRGPVDGPSSSVLRSDEATALRPIAPAGELRSGDELRFEWSDADGGEGRRYRVVVVDLDSGATVLDTQTDATFLVPAAGQVERFEPGHRYHWVVEPRGDGAATGSPATAFWIP